MNPLTSLRTILLALILSIGISYTYAAWAPPTATPTGSNAEAPVNIGSATQVKAGALTVNGLLTAVSKLVIGSGASSGGVMTINDTTGNPWVDIRSTGDLNNYSAISLWSNEGGGIWPASSGVDTNKRWAIGHRKIGPEKNNFFIEECTGNCFQGIPANYAQRLTIKPGGNVGIGVTSPTAKLHVGGTAAVDGIKFPDGTLQTTAAQNGIGYSQNWQDVSASRTGGVNYQNTTGKPIMVNVSVIPTFDPAGPTYQSNVSGYVGSSNPANILVGTDNNVSTYRVYSFISFIVPNNSYYRVENPYANTITWAELR